MNTDERKMEIKEAIKILDEVIPPPDHNTVDLERLPIAQAWSTVKLELEKLQSADPEYEEISIGEAAREIGYTTLASGWEIYHVLKQMEWTNDLVICRKRSRKRNHPENQRGRVSELQDLFREAMEKMVNDAISRKKTIETMEIREKEKPK